MVIICCQGLCIPVFSFVNGAAEFTQPKVYICSSMLLGIMYPTVVVVLICNGAAAIM